MFTYLLPFLLFMIKTIHFFSLKNQVGENFIISKNDL